MPNLIKAKNAQFAQTARDNAGKPRIRASKTTSEEAESETLESRKQNQKRGRQIVKPARKTQSTSGAWKNNRLALGLLVFVVCGGVFFELIRLFF